MNQDTQYQYRMTEAKLRMRKKTHMSESSQKAKRRLRWSLILIFGYVLAAIALYVYSLT